jgi:hypothetical protein
MKRLLVVAFLAALVSGCGGQPELPADQPLPESWGTVPAGGDLTATEPAKAVTAAYDALVAAGGVRLVTRARGNELDLSYGPGRTVGSTGSGSMRAEVRRVDGTVYVRSTPQYWQRSEVSRSAARIGTSWVRFAADDLRAGGMLLVSDLEEYVPRVLDPERWDRWGERRKIRGVDAIAVIDDQRTGSVLYLAATGKHLPLLLASKTDASSWEFLEPGKAVRATAPAGAIDGDHLPTG